MFYEIINTIVLLIANIVLGFWAVYFLSSRRTQKKMLRFLGEFYDLGYAVWKNFQQKTMHKLPQKSIPKLSAEPLSLEEIRELEKRDFDKRLRVVLRDKNIVDAEFEEIEEGQKSTNNYLSRYSKPKQR